MTRGVFVTLEGGEGVGKTTQTQRLRDWLEAQGIAVVVTREPGGSPVGEAIRGLLLDRSLPAMHADTELLLMFAARAEHVHRVIEPALAAGQWVLSDRFTDASFVYQGTGRGIDTERIAALAHWTLGDFRPDLTVVLDMPVAEGLARAHTRAAPDRFEAESLAFFERIRQGYLDLACNEPGRVRVVDARHPVDVVAESLRAHIEPWLRRR